MLTEPLRQMYSARPFQPFEIHLADGREIRVERPELLAQSHRGRTIAVSHPDDTIEIIDLLLVVSLKPRLGGGSRRRHGR